MTDAKESGKLSKPRWTPSAWLLVVGVLIGGCADSASAEGPAETFGSAGNGGAPAADDPGAGDTGSVEDDAGTGSTGGDASDMTTGPATGPDSDRGDTGRQDPSDGSTSYGPEDTYGTDTGAGESGGTTGDPGDPGEPHCCTGLPMVTCNEEPGCAWQGGKDPGCGSVCEGTGQDACTANPVCYWVGTEARICAPGDDSGPIDCSGGQGS